MITVTLKEAYALINKKEVKSVSSKMKAKLLRDIEQNFGEYEITGKGKSMRITFPYNENKEVVKTRKTREDRQENMDRVLDYLCQNYWTIDFMTNEEIGFELDLHYTTVSSIVSELRNVGYLAPKLEKVKTPFRNSRTGEWDFYMRDVNENTYFYKHYGIPVAVSHNVWKKYWDWQSDWIDYNYEDDLGAHVDKDVRKDSRSEFKRLNGFEIFKKHTRRPNAVTMERLGYEIPPCPYEIKEDVEFESFNTIEFEVVEEVVVEVVEKVEPAITKLVVPNTIGFGRISKIENFIVPVEPLYEQCIVA